jgi:DNA repair protein RadC
MIAQSTDRPVYASDNDQIIAQALDILRARVAKGPLMNAPKVVSEYCILRAGARPDQAREVFSVLWLDTQNRLIVVEDMFTGTLTQTSVYPRELVRRALAVDAAAVILTHNHPSGTTEPSRADINLTQHLKTALATVDVQVLDHIVTAGGDALSMAERGLI